MPSRDMKIHQFREVARSGKQRKGEIPTARLDYRK